MVRVTVRVMVEHSHYEPVGQGSNPAQDLFLLIFIIVLCFTLFLHFSFFHRNMQFIQLNYSFSH